MISLATRSRQFVKTLGFFVNETQGFYYHVRRSRKRTGRYPEGYAGDIDKINSIGEAQEELAAKLDALGVEVADNPDRMHK